MAEGEDEMNKFQRTRWLSMCAIFALLVTATAEGQLCRPACEEPADLAQGGLGESEGGDGTV